LKESIQNARSLGTSRPIFFRCFMTGSHVAHFKQGPLIEVVRKNKIWDVLAYGGRYDSLISRLPNTHTTQLNVCAMGVEISMDKVTTTIANYHSQSFKSLVKDQQSFGFWSPRRCDVYVISYASGFLQERMDIVALLWQAGISADLMYETGVTDADVDQREAYALEGILFTVYPRPRSGRGGNLPAFKVRSVLKGTEVDCGFVFLPFDLNLTGTLSSESSGARSLAAASHCGTEAVGCDDEWSPSEPDGLRFVVCGPARSVRGPRLARSPSRGEETSEDNQEHVHRSRYVFVSD